MAREVLKNLNILEITGLKNKVSSEVINSGFNTERKKFKLSGRVKKNTPTVIGTLQLSTEEVNGLYDNYLPKKPELKRRRNVNLNSNLSLRLKEVIEKKYSASSDSKLIVGYVFDLVYVAKENISKLKPLKYSFKSRKRKTAVPSKELVVRRVDWGSNKVKTQGENRLITLHGDPFAPFKFTVLKYVDQKDSDGRTVASTFESILDKRLTINYKHVGDGNLSKPYSAGDVEVDIIDGRLDAKGRYAFLQRFPKSTTNARYSVKLYRNTKYTNNQPWTYFPQKTYATSPVTRESLPGWEEWYCKTLVQNHPVKLILQATTNVVTYTINGQVIPSGRSSQTYSNIFYSNRPNKRHKIRYRLKTVSGSNNLAVNGGYAVVFDNKGGTSSWTNSDFGANGGTKVNISNIVSTSSLTGDTGNDLAEISFDLEILRWGTSNVTMAFAINNEITVSS